MLFAKKGDGIVHASCNLKRSDEFECRYEYCPSPRLILKKGPRRIVHFAHKARTRCDSYAEPETNAHIAMKLLLQRRLKIPDRLVEYGKIPKVRPDLVWKDLGGKRKFAIEVQHSPIQVEEVERRNQIYLARGYTPLWVLHAQEIDERLVVNKTFPFFFTDSGDGC